MQNNNNYALDLINILSFIIGVQNLSLNDKQISELQEHLNRQDEQYEKIISLLEEKEVIRKEALHERK